PPLPLSRRDVLIGGAGAGAGLLMPSLASAQTKLVIPEGNVAPLPIAIPNFVAGTPADGEVGVGIAGVITNNLKRSELFAPINPDQIYERLTGDKGYFDSRVVFVDETGAKERRVKRLALMDQDGANVRYLTRGADLVLTPRFSPSTQEITYMEFGQGDPRVYLFNIETGQREIVGNFPGMSFAPRFSPDG